MQGAYRQSIILINDNTAKAGCRSFDDVKQMIVIGLASAVSHRAFQAAPRLPSGAEFGQSHRAPSLRLASPSESEAVTGSDADLPRSADIAHISARRERRRIDEVHLLLAEHIAGEGFDHEIASFDTRTQIENGARALFGKRIEVLLVEYCGLMLTLKANMPHHVAR